MTLLDISASTVSSDSTLPAGVGCEEFDSGAALRRAKYAYSTRFVYNHRNRSSMQVDTDLSLPPNVGDVVLARVTEIGQHKRLEGPGSRRQTLFLGDEIVVAYGSRYAADQFLAVLPGDLRPCNLAAAGGLAAEVLEYHDNMDPATVIEPIGLVTKADGTRVNLRDCSPFELGGSPIGASSDDDAVPVIGVLGTSMNSGKSTTLACLAHGFVQAGLRVHVGKATGTGAGNDAHLFTDAGAHRVLDFTDFGLPTTFGLSHSEVREVFTSLADELSADVGEGRPDVVLVEIADGIFQGETRQLLTDEGFTERVDSIVFAAGDALGAVGGVSTLESLGHVPTLVSGVVTASPLATREAKVALDVPVVPTFDLCDPSVASGFVSIAHARA